MSLYWASSQVALHLGDVREVLAAMPAESVHMIVTSPPYLGQRDYGVEPSIWGGDPNCPHTLDVQAIAGERYSGRTRWQHVAQERRDRHQQALPGHGDRTQPPTEPNVKEERDAP